MFNRKMQVGYRAEYKEHTQWFLLNSCIHSSKSAARRELKEWMKSRETSVTGARIVKETTTFELVERLR